MLSLHPQLVPPRNCSWASFHPRRQVGFDIRLTIVWPDRQLPALNQPVVANVVGVRPTVPEFPQIAFEAQAGFAEAPRQIWQKRHSSRSMPDQKSVV